MLYSAKRVTLRECWDIYKNQLALCLAVSRAWFLLSSLFNRPSNSFIASSFFSHNFSSINVPCICFCSGPKMGLGA